MDELLSLVKNWFFKRGLDKANPDKQMLKLQEEIGELAEGMVKGDEALVVDSIGDILVVLTGLTLQLDLDLEYCLRTAYNEIADRKGEVINGVFVKESDVEVMKAHAEYTKAIKEYRKEN